MAMSTEDDLEARRGTDRLIADLQGRLAKAEADLAASQAEVERLRVERDEATKRASVAERCHDDCGRALTYHHKREQAAESDLAAALAREMALRACLETVFAQHGDPNGEDPGCMMTRATYERIDDLLHNPTNAAPSPACPSSAGRKCHVDAPECLYKHGDSECAAPCLGPTRHAACPSCERMRGILRRVMGLTAADLWFRPGEGWSVGDAMIDQSLFAAASSAVRADAALARAEGTHEGGETHEERWQRLGYFVEWWDDYRDYAIWTLAHDGPETVVAHAPTVQAVDEWIAARATHATKEGK